MKTLVLKVSFLCLMMLSFSSFADKVMLTGQPVVLEQKGDMYVVPATYKSTTDYNYVTIGGKNRVCYLEKQPALASLDVMTVNVDVGGTTAAWNCYEYSADYFDVAP